MTKRPLFAIAATVFLVAAAASGGTVAELTDSERFMLTIGGAGNDVATEGLSGPMENTQDVEPSTQDNETETPLDNGTETPQDNGTETPQDNGTPTPTPEPSPTPTATPESTETPTPTAELTEEP